MLHYLVDQAALSKNYFCVSRLGLLGVVELQSCVIKFCEEGLDKLEDLLVKILDFFIVRHFRITVVRPLQL